MLATWLGRPPVIRLNTSLFLKHAHSYAGLPSPPVLHSLETPEDMNQARDWIARFRSETIPKALVELSFSRSSGPGGQNVNKVNTKATVRCAADAGWIPPWSAGDLRSSPFYVAKSHSILVTSTLHRSQAQNIDDCLSKLRNIIADAASQSIRNEASQEQKDRVAQLERSENARRKTDKMKHSSKKASRNSRGWE